MLQPIVHYFLQFIAIAAIARWYNREKWFRNWLILAATMLVDLDHLLAEPIFHPMRCSIGFHLLHQEYLALLYLAGALLLKRSLMKLVLIGLSFHMLTDLIDCMWMSNECESCILPSYLG